MCAKWDEFANGVDKAQKCDICRKQFEAKDLRIYHALGPGWLRDHLTVDKGCADKLLPDLWAGCGCGG